MIDSLKTIDYQHLGHLQVGRIGEYLVKLNLTLHGFDVYTSEVDDKGIDFIIRLSADKYIDVQVKTIRSLSSYVYVDKTSKSWQQPFKQNLYLALVILTKDPFSDIYLIPAAAWNNPNDLFKSRDYTGSKKSKPDWGLNLSKKNMGLLSEYKFDNFLNHSK